MPLYVGYAVASTSAVVASASASCEVVASAMVVSASTLAGTESVVWVDSDIGIQMFNEESQTKSV